MKSFTPLQIRKYFETRMPGVKFNGLARAAHIGEPVSRVPVFPPTIFSGALAQALGTHLSELIREAERRLSRGL